MTVPDFISPVVGYRVWQWGATGLRSLNGEKWVAHQPLSAVCRADVGGSIAGLSKSRHNPAELPCFSCTCGVYAAKTIEHLRQCGYKKFGVHGEVYLWGKVVEHRLGWRAQFAYPKSLFLPPDTVPFTLAEIDARLKTLIAFGADIFIVGDHESIRFWKNGSGYDAAGLDYIIQMRQKHYVRQQQERMLKKGDRVALLGQGIAVVERVDEGEAVVILGNGLVSTIRRQDIVLNQHNRRWECGSNPLGSGVRAKT